MPGRRVPGGGGFHQVAYGDVPGHAPMELDPDDPPSVDIDSLPENTSLVTVDGEEFSTTEDYMKQVHLPHAAAFLASFAVGVAAGGGALAGTAAATLRATLDLSKETARTRRRELADRALAALSPKLREKIALPAYLVIEDLANEKHEEAEERIVELLTKVTRAEAVSFLDVVSEAVPGLPYDVQRELIDLLPEERKEAPRAKPAKSSILDELGIPGGGAPPQDIYQAAAASGLVTENQFCGLGAIEIPARTEKGPGVAKLQDCINRNIWLKSIVLDGSDGQDHVLVSSIVVAGLPINVGNQATPLVMFSANSTRSGVSLGRRLSLVGQTVVVSLENHSDKPVFVSGGIICDEMNPYAMQTWMEQMLLQAAVSGFSEIGEQSSVSDEVGVPEHAKPLRPRRR